jgi:hypothetical protein
MLRCPQCGSNFQAPALAPTAAPGLPGPPAESHAASPPTQTDVYTVVEPTTQPQPPIGQEPLRLKEASGVRMEREVPPRPAAPPPPPPLPPVGYMHTRTIYLTPRIVPWLAPVCLVLVFVLLWCTWIMEPVKTDIYQTGWGTAFGKDSNLLGTIHVLIFLPALLLAIAIHAVPHLSVELPPWAKELWPHRAAILAAITFISFMFLVIELGAGFGIEQANQGKEVYHYLRRTGWLDLAVLLQLVAIVGAVFDYWLRVRQNRPLPKIEVSW